MVQLFSADGRLLYFTSDRAVPGEAAKPGEFHLWTARRNGVRWGAPTPVDGDLGSAVYPATTLNGDLYFTRMQGAGSLIYHAVLKAGQATDIVPSNIQGVSAGQDEANPPAPPRVEPYKTHLAYVKERRSDADGEAILAEALQRLRSF